MLLAAAILGVALIIGHLILVLIRFWGSAPAPMVTSGSVTSTGLTPTRSRAQIVTTPTPTSTPPIVVVTPVPTPIPKPAVEPTAISTPTPTNEQLAKKSLEQAYTDEKKGDYNDAIRNFTEVIRLKPGYQKAYHARGTVYTELKQYEKAIGDFTEAIKLKPDDAALYNNRAHAYQHLKQYEKAIADFNAAIGLEPGNVSYYNDRGIVFDALGNKARADQDHRKAEELRSSGHVSTSSPTPVAAPTSTPNARKTESPNATPAVSGADHFDGTWSVSVVAPDQRDATGKVVRGFRSQYTVHVQNGVLRGEHKSHPSQRGYSSWLRIDGKIQPDGSADLRVNGLSGDPIDSPAGEKPGTPYTYEVRAHFAGNYGTGNSVGFRIHNFTFARSSFGN